MSQLAKKRHIQVIESARGIAAAYVVAHHIVILFELKRVLPPTALVECLLGLFTNFGNTAVTLFFLLSGFSVHYTSIDRMRWSAAEIRDYYYRRWRRIYPIFIFAIALALLAMFVTAVSNQTGSADWPSAGELLATPLFLTDLPFRQGTWFPALSTNAPVWSLSYEVVYYLLYPIFWLVAQKHGVVRAVVYSAVLSSVNLAFGAIILSNHLSNVMGLYFLWCLGASLGEGVRRDIHFKISVFWFFPVFITLVNILWPLESLMTWRVPGSYQTLWGVTFFLVMLLFFGGFRESIWPTTLRIWLGIGSLTLTVLFSGLVHVVKVGGSTSFYNFRVLTTGLLALVWLAGRPDSIISWIRGFLRPWHSAGAYSYGLYVIHYPVLIIALSICERWMPWPWHLTAIVCIAPIVYLAAIMELQVQPKIARALDRLCLAPSRMSNRNAS